MARLSAGARPSFLSRLPTLSQTEWEGRVWLSHGVPGRESRELKRGVPNRISVARLDNSTVRGSGGVPAAASRMGRGRDGSAPAVGHDRLKTGAETVLGVGQIAINEAGFSSLVRTPARSSPTPEQRVWAVKG